jgi:hypothetical protein
MKKLLFILLAFLALFTFIRAFDSAEAGEKSLISTEIQGSESVE